MMGQSTHGNAQHCPRCHVGALDAVTVTYSAVYRGALFSVPAVPAWLCDICGYIEYDEATMERLEALVGETLMERPDAGMEGKLTPIEPDADMPEPKPRSRVKQR
jgi:YgiT-type zinc finger domain-containing protein